MLERQCVPCILALILFALTFALASGNSATAMEIEIELASGSARERAGEIQLQGILARYNLETLIFTRLVRIEGGIIPHSHPVLTLNTRHLKDDELQLATFLHEQIHWFCTERGEAVEAALADLKEFYPDVPIGFPQGARDKESVYLHLIVNLLELDALERVLGTEKARAVIGRKDYYLWIYDKILWEQTKIRPVLTKHGLELPRS